MKQQQNDTVPWSGFRDPRIILKQVLAEAGDNPDTEKYFKRTPSGLLIHSSRAVIQYFLGGILLILIPIVMDGLYIELTGKTIEKGLPERNALMVWLILGAVACLVFGVALYCLTAVRETWWNASTGEILIRTRMFFISRTKKCRSSSVKAVQLRGKVREGQGADVTFWNVRLEMMDSKIVPITIPVFSESAVTQAAGNQAIEKSLGKLPFMAWAFSRSLDVPLDFVYKDVIVSANAVDQITILMDDNKYRTDEKYAHQLKTSLIFRIMCSLIVCIILIECSKMVENLIPKSYETPSLIVILAITLLLIGLSVSSYYKSKPR